jgi:hypothetical protein
MQNLTSEKDGGAARSRAVSSRIRGVVAVVVAALLGLLVCIE